MQQYKALHPTQPSNFKAALKSDEHKFLFGCAVAIPSILVARQVAMIGYDWAFIDAEHGAMSQADLKEIVHAIQFYSEGRTIPVVRLPAHEPSWIAVALDAGAGGVIMPHCESVEQVEEFIAEARFAPEGSRSFPPFSWFRGVNDQVPPGETIYSVANKHIAVIPQLESRKGIENAEAIFAIPGVDAVMVGAGDLGMDMGLFGLPGENRSELAAALDKVRDLGLKYYKAVGGFAPPEVAEMWQHRVHNNYKFLVVASDVVSMTNRLVATNAEVREYVKGVKPYTSKTPGRA